MATSNASEQARADHAGKGSQRPLRLLANHGQILRWKLLVGALVVVAVGCSSGGSASTTVSGEVAAAQCGQAVDLIHDFKVGMYNFREEDMVRATDSMRKVGDGDSGTELSDLLDGTTRAMESLSDALQRSDDHSPAILEFRRSAAALGLWCIDHTTSDVSADLAGRFAQAT